VAFIADTHVIGPQYTCCSESDGVDNDSIMHTPARLASTIAQINAIEPPPDRVFLLGDVLHAAHHSTDPDFYETEETAFSVAAELLAELEAPLHILWGNHDYEVDCNQGPDHHERELSHQLFARFFDTEPYGVVDDGGWRFVLTNSQLGPTWDVESSDCDTEFGSYGEEQLAWLDGLLGEGMPSVVMSHHHMLTATASNENDGENPDLSTVIGRHDNVAMHMAGHMHRWYDFEPATLSPVRHIILGATRYDTDNFWLAEFGAEGTYEILDYDKPQWQTTCADTWSYAGAPELDGSGTEDGDCSF
jgi:predicted phosphodiesterase